MISRREMIRCSAIAGAAAIAGLAFAGCSDGQEGQAASSAASAAGDAAGSRSAGSAASAAAAADAQKADSIVVYFSRADENYRVGYIEEGNTAIVAGMVAGKTGADMFEIVPAEAYPEGYDECCDVALAEQDAGARPAYVGDVDLAPYDTVYLGYPIWWGDLPMCVHTFVEAHDWSGKDIRPFCTHAGSGLAGTADALRAVCAGATVADGLAILGSTAQNSREEAQAAVDGWLA